MADATREPTEDGGAKPGVSHYEQIVHSLTSGVIAVDGNGVLTIVNPMASAHLSLDPTSLRVGRPIEESPELAGFAEIMREMMETREPVIRRELVIDDGRGKRIIGMTSSLMQGPDTSSGAVFLFTDLTEVRRLEHAAAVNRQLAQLGELTAGVVHELRNPLGVISGMAELLMRRLEQDETLHQRAATIFEEAAQLEALVNQFLGFAKPFSIESSRCAPEQVAGRAESLCRPVAGQRSVEMEVSVEEETGEFQADAVKLAQALSNLLRNAIEVSPPGGRVSLALRRDHGEMVFRVEDEGPGIHLEEGEDLFSPFFSRKESGTGLGLAVANRIATAHGGTIQYGNRPSGGAWFELRVPG